MRGEHYYMSETKRDFYIDSRLKKSPYYHHNTYLQNNFGLKWKQYKLGLKCHWIGFIFTLCLKLTRMYDATFFRYCVAERSEQIFTGECLVRDMSKTSVQILRAPFFLLTLTCKFQLPFLARIPASSSGETVSFTKCSH